MILASAFFFSFHISHSLDEPEHYGYPDLVPIFKDYFLVAQPDPRCVPVPVPKKLVRSIPADYPYGFSNSLILIFLAPL